MRFIRTHSILLVTILIATAAGCNACREEVKNASESDSTTETSKHSDKEVPEADSGALPASLAIVSDPAMEEEIRQASLEGNNEKVKELLDGGANVNASDQEGHTALMFAAYNGHLEIVRALTESGAIVDQRDLMGRTALLYASSGPFPETVKILLDKGAEPNIVDSNEHFSPLMHAAAEGNLEVVKILLEHHADLTLTDVDGDDAETFARQAGHEAVSDHLNSIR